jgi:hypothetical protein
MDKVRAFMKVLWVQRFWVLSVVGVLAAVVCWLLASGALQAEFEAEKSAIETQFTNINAIQQKPFHGNDVVNAKEREEAAKIADNVQKLWQRLYEHQRERVLFWPEMLGKEFLEHIEKRKFNQSISNAMRDRYLNYIEKQFDALVEIVDAQKMDPSTAGSFGGEMGGRFEGPVAVAPGQPGFEEDYLVQWHDQGALRAKLQFGHRPTATEVWVRQEDLWVYETLLRVIDNTNKARNATRPDNTAIRVIEMLQVGAEAGIASAQQANIMMPAGALAAEGGLGMEGGMVMGREGMPMPGGYGGEGGLGVEGDPAAADAALLNYRYLGDDGAPMADASTGTGTEYRRLPVLMRLQMDPSWIPQVLVQCANAPLPIEVKRLRINPEKALDGFDATFGAPMGGEGGGGYRGGYGGGGGRGYGGEGGFTPSLATGAPGANLVSVELHGVVYIYNPPDPAVLTVPGGENLAAADTTVVR